MLALQYHELLSEGEVLQQQAAATTKSTKDRSEPKLKQVKHGSKVIAAGLFGLAPKLLISTWDRIVTRDSNYSAFGSGVTVQGMGFVLQNRGGLFSVDPASPNALAGRKRPFHTIIPGFMERGDQHIGFGIMGGMNQPLAHAQFVSNVVDYKMNIQAALEEPRFTVNTRLGCNIVIESRVTPESIEQLTKMGDSSGRLWHRTQTPALTSRSYFRRRSNFWHCEIRSW